MKEYSKTFCIYPWIQQQTTPSGRVNFCCISFHTSVEADDGRPISLDKDSFQDAWNTEYMKDIRRKMVNGQPVKGCETCYEQEKIGKKSYRQSHNEEWSSKMGAETLEKIVGRSIEADFSVDTPPAYLDLRLGNLCNLKCRMCNPTNSIQVYKEWEKLDVETGGQYSEFWEKQGLQFSGTNDWYESENFWQSVEKYVPHLKKVYMTGGEPTLILGNYRFLNRCRELGYASQIELFFNLNFTNIKDAFIEQLRDFRWTGINASLDGFGPVNEYIRGNSRWDILDKNFRKMARESGRNVGLGISPVIQVYNVLNIVELLEYAEEVGEETGKEILIDFLFCFHPVMFDIANLPASVKQEAIRRMNEFKDTSYSYRRKGERFSFLKNGVDSMIARLEQTMDKEDPEQLRNLLAYTKTLDLKRGQNFSEVFPELDFLLKKAGYDYRQAAPISAAAPKVMRHEPTISHQC